jgi:hypothetical protein
MAQVAGSGTAAAEAIEPARIGVLALVSNPTEIRFDPANLAKPKKSSSPTENRRPRSLAVSENGALVGSGIEEKPGKELGPKVTAGSVKDTEGAPKNDVTAAVPVVLTSTGLGSNCSRGSKLKVNVSVVVTPNVKGPLLRSTFSAKITTAAEAGLAPTRETAAVISNILADLIVMGGSFPSDPPRLHREIPARING